MQSLPNVTKSKSVSSNFNHFLIALTLLLLPTSYAGSVLTRESNTLKELSNHKMVVEPIYSSSTLEAQVVSGTWREIGQAAAKTKSLDAQALFPLAVRKTLDHAMTNFFKWSKISFGISDYLLSRYQKFILTSEKEMIAGFAEESGISSDIIEKAFVCPEVQNWILLKIKALTTGVSACSSFVGQDRDGKILFGRNMDYDAAGILDKNLSVYLVKPKDKARIITVAPRGFVIPGLSGMNEYGVVVTLNVVMSQKISSKGLLAPILSVNREVLEDARSVPEALEIYKRYSYMSGWLVQIADTKGNTGVVELSGLGVNYVPANQETKITALTNSYLSTHQKTHEVQLSPGVAIHNQDRLKRLMHLVQERISSTSEKIALHEAFKILSDSFSPTSNSAVVFSSSGIRTVEQVMSMVFLPQEGAVWVADDALAPTSLTRHYTRFSFDSMESALTDGTFVSERFNVDENLVLPGQDQNEQNAARKALNAFVLANTQHSDDPRAAYEHVKEAARISPDCSFDLYAGSYALQFGLKSKNATENANELKIAEESLDKARNCQILNFHQQAIRAYLQGILGLSKNEFEQAVNHFDEAEELESQLQASMKVNPDASLLQNIKRYRDYARKKTSGIGNWYIHNPELHIEKKFGDRLLGWNL